MVGAAARAHLVEQGRGGIAPDDDVGAAALDTLLEVLVVPVGNEAERVLRRVLEPAPLRMLVPVQEAHVACAGAVGLLHDRAGNRGLLDVEGEDEDVLPLGDVRADADGEPPERPLPLSSRRHAGILAGR